MRIGYAAILSSILLLASVAIIGLSVAQNNAPLGEWVIHDSQHPCIFNDNAGPDTTAYFWDADGDGHDHLVGTDPPESVPSEIIACFGAEHFPVVSGEDLIVLQTLCGIYGNSIQITIGGRQETVSFGEWISLFRPDLLDLFNDVGCPGEIRQVTWSHQFIVIAPSVRFDDDAAISRAAQFDNVPTFSGDLSGNCAGDYNWVVRNRAESETNNFLWVIACEAMFDGKSGTIVLLVKGVHIRGASGRPDASTAQFTWEIVDSGGELENLTGKGTGEYSRAGSVPFGGDCLRDRPQGCSVFEGTFEGEFRLPN